MPSVQLPRPIEVKLAIIGDVKCGKSCLIKRFCEKRYTAKYFPTIGVDFGIKRYGSVANRNCSDLEGLPSETNS
ncbi:hypothetical protein X801_10314 [Opisthorchis viverrini]|uniref:Ras family protein n=1 Tax=Opisthorchis viverrini TaxID=6198 RepID=A0A1S8WHG9_OPIVI|nr:hypothetical protein X801_10314 [Opisthorchis viverrini]